MPRAHLVRGAALCVAVTVAPHPAMASPWSPRLVQPAAPAPAPAPAAEVEPAAPAPAPAAAVEPAAPAPAHPTDIPRPAWREEDDAEERAAPRGDGTGLLVAGITMLGLGVVMVGFGAARENDPYADGLLLLIGGVPMTITGGSLTIAGGVRRHRYNEVAEQARLRLGPGALQLKF